jgi:hypothetical protein
MSDSNTTYDSNSLNYFNIILYVPLLTIKACWTAMCVGMPFGGTLGAIMMTVMSNDSGEYPFAPIIAAITSLPIAIICDSLLYIPCIIVRKWNSTTHVEKKSI